MPFRRVLFAPSTPFAFTAWAGSVLLLIVAPGLRAAEVIQFGGETSWSVNWTPLSGLSDGPDAVSSKTLDLIGDASTPVGSWGADASYVYFRMRVDTPTITSQITSGSFLVMIDRVGVGNVGPDFAFAWDAQSNQPTRHGLEFSTINGGVLGPTWGSTRFDDIDGSSGDKLAIDINGAGRTGDGFVRTLDGQSGGTAGTSFIDFKVSWDYLVNYSTSGLGPGQEWRISLATISNATDHNVLSGDVIGSLGDSPTLGWSAAITAIPEPADYGAVAALTAGLAGYVARRRKREEI